MTQNTFDLLASEAANDSLVDREHWELAIRSLHGRYPKMTALECKATYVFGMMRHLLEAAGWALDTATTVVTVRATTHSRSTFLLTR